MNRILYLMHGRWKVHVVFNIINKVGYVKWTNKDVCEVFMNVFGLDEKLPLIDQQSSN